jgi:hypothetical protein
MCGNVLVNRNYAQKADFPQEKFRRALAPVCSAVAGKMQPFMSGQRCVSVMRNDSTWTGKREKLFFPVSRGPRKWPGS